MGVKLKHASGNGTVLGAPAANPSADITLKAPSTTGSAGQVLAVASANHSSTNAELEWVANSAGTGRKILEQFFSPCDGSAIALNQGSTTLPDVTAGVTPGTSFADLAATSISYVPPSGTTNVIYEFNFHYFNKDSDPYFSFAFYIDSDEVTQARCGYGGQYNKGNVSFKWGINIGGSADTTSGRLASWSSAKTLKIQATQYSNTREGTLFETSHWTGSGTSGVFSCPSLGITAIG